HPYRPFPRLRPLIYPLRPHAKLFDGPRPSFPTGAALIPIAAKKVWVPGRLVDIPEPGHIKPRGGPPPRVLFQVTIHAARSAYPEVVVHQVVAELSTVVSETGGKAIRLTIQHNQCSVQRPCIQENDPGKKLFG